MLGRKFKTCLVFTIGPRGGKIRTTHLTETAHPLHRRCTEKQELAQLVAFGWLRGVDLNHRPLGYEPNELPDCSTPRSDHNNRFAAASNGDVTLPGAFNRHSFKPPFA